MGRYRCHPGDAEWSRENEVRRGPLLVFPHVGVGIESLDAVLADPNVVMLYNHGQRYRRRLVDDTGDRCVWLQLEPEVLDQAGARCVETPFERTHVPCASGVHLAHRVLAGRALSGDDELLEELALALCDRLLEQALGPATDRPTDHRVINETKAVLATSYAERLTLERIARDVHISRFHLARVFRAGTGESIHRYLTRLRLHRALDALEDPARRIVEVALSHGFSSHAHFTDVFRREFGVTPKEARENGTNLKDWSILLGS